MSDNGNVLYFSDIVEDKKVVVDLFSGKIAILPKENINENKKEDFISDTETVKAYISKVRRSSKHIGFTILTTLNCNLNCTYCYEKNLVDKKAVLSEAEVEKVVLYVLFQVKKYNSKKVTVVYSGGEPLLNKKSLLICSKRLYEELEKIGVEFKISIVSNGTVHLEPSEFALLKQYGLKLIQISLDGPKDIHNKRRVAAFDVYKRVVEFIECCAEEVETVLIRINIDNENKDELERVFKELKHIDKRNVYVSYYLTEVPICERNKCEPSNDFENNSIILKSAIADANKNGFQVVQETGLKSHCMSSVPFNTVIAPNGKLYKCAGMVGLESQYLGNIDEPIEADNKAIEHVNNRMESQCYNCKLIPMCMGGCNYNKYGKEGCNNEYKEYVLKKVKNRVALILEKNLNK